jgi:putative Ca2+/H+ antiporter (TMEM165/GDT1 family)
VIDAFLLSFGVIFLAELGDKSQLMALAFAARFPALPVLVAITVATALVHLGSVALGATVALAVPANVIAIVAGVAFLVFAAWTLHGDRLDERDEQKAERATGSVILTVGIAFFLAELGDKTMLATVALASTHNWAAVWTGATAGMVLADGVGAGMRFRAVNNRQR